MGMTRLVFQPGIDSESTETSSKGGWSRSNLIRWREGYVEKLLGWAKICVTPVTGVCRALHYWADLASMSWIAAGTESNLHVESNGVLYDITPLSFVPGAVSSGGVPFSLLIWSLDNFGQLLLACPSKQGIYYWNPPLTGVLALPITQAPASNQGMFVTMPQEIVMAFGSQPPPGSLVPGPQDPMLVTWCSQSDYTDWIPSTTNQAGSYRLSRGNRIVGGLQCPLGSFLWTDVDIWSVQYEGFPLVFGFFQVGSLCGLIAQKAATAAGQAVYWMSDHGFFQYSGGSGGAGGAEPIPCPVWDVVYKNLDLANEDKCFAATDYLYNEVWWFFPSLSGGTGEIDSYVKYNVLEKLWDYGMLIRTAWTDQNRPGPPIGVDSHGFLQQHDTGIDNDGAAMTGVMVQSGYTDIADGEQFLFVDQMLPDALWTSSTATPPMITASLLFRNWPGDNPTTVGPFTISPTTEYITCRCRGREVALLINCDGLGSWFRLGTFRLRSAPAGRV